MYFLKIISCEQEVYTDSVLEKTIILWTLKLLEYRFGEEKTRKLRQI